MTNSEKAQLSETSPSVQTHLNIIQSVIQRMATNSTSCKAWGIALVSAVLVIVADSGNPEFAWIAIIPTLLFLALDAYYLALEKGFRESYNYFVRKVHDGTIAPEDLYAINPRGKMLDHQIAAFRSFSVWSFYLTLLAMIAIIRLIVLV